MWVYAFVVFQVAPGLQSPNSPGATSSSPPGARTSGALAPPGIKRPQPNPSSA